VGRKTVGQEKEDSVRPEKKGRYFAYQKGKKSPSFLHNREHGKGRLKGKFRDTQKKPARKRVSKESSRGALIRRRRGHRGSPIKLVRRSRESLITKRGRPGDNNVQAIKKNSDGANRGGRKVRHKKYLKKGLQTKFKRGGKITGTLTYR